MKEHGVLLYLPKPLYLAFIKLQADKGLGRSFAGLLPFVEGLYTMGYINKEIYLQYVKRYSRPLIEEKKSVQLLRRQKQEKQAEKELNKTLGMVAAQWSSHPSALWRRKWKETAMKNKTLPNAIKVLDVADKGVNV